MIGAVITLKIKEGMEAEFEAGFRDLAAKVKAHEPDVLMYQLTRSRTEIRTYKVLELYRDAEAQAYHGQTDHYKAAIATLFAPTLAGRPEGEFLDGVD